MLRDVLDANLITFDGIFSHSSAFLDRCIQRLGEKTCQHMLHRKSCQGKSLEQQQFPSERLFSSFPFSSHHTDHVSHYFCCNLHQSKSLRSHHFILLLASRTFSTQNANNIPNNQMSIREHINKQQLHSWQSSPLRFWRSLKTINWKLVPQ